MEGKLRAGAAGRTQMRSRLSHALRALAAVSCLLVAAPAAAQERPDVCPNGWSSEATVWFAPPRVDSGVPNRERANGCTMADDEPGDDQPAARDD